MIEKVFPLSKNTERTIEKVIQDDNLDYIHMQLNKNEGLPRHLSNSNVYMTVLKGPLSIGLDEQVIAESPAGTLLQLPHRTLMIVQNLHDEMLELIVIKAPTPKHYQS